jgi:branched-chain amino acid transport system permease protein
MIAITIGGLAIGAIYGLMAVGVVLIFRTTARVNFAHGEVLMLGGYAYWLATKHSDPAVLQIVLVLALGILLGAGFFVVTHYLLGRSDELTVVIGTLGVSVVMLNAVRLHFTDSGHRVPGWLTGYSTVPIGSGEVVPSNTFMILGVGIVSTLALHLWFQRTRMGQSVRAVAESREDAALSGIPVRRMLLLSWAGGCAFATLSGLLLSPSTDVYPQMGGDILFKGFVAAALGGFESIVGAMVGGLLLGLIEVHSNHLIGSEYKDLISFAILLAVLLVRPSGLLGRAQLRRV